MRQCVLAIVSKKQDALNEKNDLLWAQYHVQQMWCEYLGRIENLIKQYQPLDVQLLRFIYHRLLFRFDSQTQNAIKVTLEKFVNVLQFDENRVHYSLEFYEYTKIPDNFNATYRPIFGVFNEALHPIDFAVDDIPGVGNCFPESIRAQLRDLPEFNGKNTSLLKPETQRQMVVEYMKHHPRKMIQDIIPGWIRAYKTNPESMEWKFVEPYLQLDSCETVFNAMMHQQLFEKPEFYFEEATILFLITVLESPVHLNRKVLLVVVDDTRSPVVVSSGQRFQNGLTPLVTFVYRVNNNHYQSFSVRGKRHFDLDDRLSLLSPKILQLLNDKIK
jgi:hypothetical protein